MYYWFCLYLPFYSIKEEGIGLGLMVCYKVIETHQGKVFIANEVNKGTIVEVILSFLHFKINTFFY
ncbi:hypothetical protein CN629_24490 [Bacillus toyonensis]|nr:hypothetical protein CN629_24490 [Bacillus toyonensis]